MMKTMKRNNKATDVRLKLDGIICDKNGIEIGEYHYSLYNNTYSWKLHEFDEPHHFWHKEELIDTAKENGWTLQ